MVSRVKSSVLDGISARPVWVEVGLGRGLPSFAMVGLPEVVVRETRERVRAALVNSGFEFPLRRIVVDLAPAGLRRAAPGTDLAIAAALLLASGQLDWDDPERFSLAGELALDGEVRPVLGALAIAEGAREDGARAVVVPVGNGPEAALVEGIEVITLRSLGELPALAAGRHPGTPLQPPEPATRPRAGEPDLADLRGQAPLRRALEVAAAGGHGMLMVGPPGAGTSLAAARLPTLLPPLDAREALEVARIAGATGRFGARQAGTRPFRAPHHAISVAGLIGGGNPPRPGEVTLAHQGVLFLDELDQFRLAALEELRAPLRRGKVTVTGGGRTVHMPARFQLLAAANPCPCGRGEDDPDCSCRPETIKRHRSCLAAALAGRIDALIAVPRPGAEEVAGPTGESSAVVRERVCAARRHQEARLGSGRCNAEMSSAEARGCELGAGAAALLAELHSRRPRSSPTVDRALRLARTVADLCGAEVIGTEEMSEALRLVRGDRV